MTRMRCMRYENVCTKYLNECWNDQALCCKWDSMLRGGGVHVSGSIRTTNGFWTFLNYDWIALFFKVIWFHNKRTHSRIKCSAICSNFSAFYHSVNIKPNNLSKISQILFIRWSLVCHQTLYTLIMYPLI